MCQLHWRTAADGPEKSIFLSAMCQSLYSVTHHRNSSFSKGTFFFFEANFTHQLSEEVLFSFMLGVELQLHVRYRTKSTHLCSSTLTSQRRAQKRCASLQVPQHGFWIDKSAPKGDLSYVLLITQINTFQPIVVRISRGP